MIELSHPAVRDLAGVMASPGLLDARARPDVVSDEECAAELERHAWRLLELDRDPEPLLAWLEDSRTSPRLGHYFEALLGFWIRELMGARRFEPGLKIQRERATLGELDFVFEDASGFTQHWEASVKFYLCNASTADEALDTRLYVGTMTRDTLARKLDKLFGQQLRAASEPAALETLQSLGFAAPVRSRAMVKGTLFYPLRGDWRHHPHPVEVSVSHSRGWWSRGFDFEAFDPGSRWAVLPRARWLAPFRGGNGWDPLTHLGMREFCRGHFEEHRHALMVARVSKRGDAWIEEDRGVVTHRGWPGM